jgi:hypothetical protein
MDFIEGSLRYAPRALPANHQTFYGAGQLTHQSMAIDNNEMGHILLSEADLEKIMLDVDRAGCVECW